MAGTAEQRKRHHEWNKRRRRERKAAGICTDCGKPAVSGKTLCQACLDSAVKRQLVRRRKYITAGKCIQCGKPVIFNKRYCQICFDRDRKRQRVQKDKWKAAGICTSCGSRAARPGRMDCETCAKHFSQRSQEQNRVVKQGAFLAYGGIRCACCGETDIDVLELDHMNNDGGAWRKKHKIKGGNQFYRWLKRHNYPDLGLQVLCRNCNWRRRINGGICPHKEDEELAMQTYAI